MAEKIKKRSVKAGLPPGSLIHIGEKRVEPEPDPHHRLRRECVCRRKQRGRLEECYPFKDTDSVTWIDIEGLQDIELLEHLGSCYGLHPLILEDILNTDQRPKLDDMQDYIYVVLKMLDFNPAGDKIISEQVSIIFGKNFVISLQEGREGDLFEPLRERIRGSKGRIRKLGPDYLAYAILDSIIDRYFLILEKIAEKIEVLEEDLISRSRARSLAPDP